MGTVLFPTAKLLWASILLFIDVTFLTPSYYFIFVVLIVMFLDLVTGVMRAKLHGEERTSTGYRKTLIKFNQYIIPLVVLYGAYFILKWRVDTMPKVTQEDLDSIKSGKSFLLILKQITGVVMYYIVYIEVTSIFENLYNMDKTSTIAKFLYKPALKILKFGYENNPIVKAADKLKEE